jgi:hypothetical protein
MNKQELINKLEVARAAKVAEMAEIVEIAKLNHELTKLDSPLYAKRELTKIDSTALDVLLVQVEEEYAKDDRKISQTFGYGIIPNKIITLLKAIQFSKAQLKEDLLLMTGLDEQVIEDTLDAFGNTAYFSKTAVEVIPAMPMDIPRVKELLEMVAIDMKLVSDLDLCKFNPANVDYQYKRSQLNADEMLDNTNEYITAATIYKE